MSAVSAQNITEMGMGEASGSVGSRRREPQYLGPGRCRISRLALPFACVMASVSLLSGCATLLYGPAPKRQQISISSNPTGAQVTRSGRGDVGMTPLILDVGLDEYAGETLLFKAPGYPGRIEVLTKKQPGALPVIADCLLGGPCLIGIDILTDAGRVYPSEMNIRMPTWSEFVPAQVRIAQTADGDASLKALTALAELPPEAKAAIPYLLDFFPDCAYTERWYQSTPSLGDTSAWRDLWHIPSRLRPYTHYQCIREVREHRMPYSPKGPKFYYEVDADYWVHIGACALHAITGQDFGADRGKWAEWWESAQRKQTP